MEELAPYMRGWRSYFGFCETPEVLIGLTRWVRLRLRASGGSGKHRAVAKQHCWNSGCDRGWQVIPLVVGSALGTLRRPKPSLWGFLMRTSNRLGFRHCSKKC